MEAESSSAARHEKLIVAGSAAFDRINRCKKTVSQARGQSHGAVKPKKCFDCIRRSRSPMMLPGSVEKPFDVNSRESPLKRLVKLTLGFLKTLIIFIVGVEFTQFFPFASAIITGTIATVLGSVIVTVLHPGANGQSTASPPAAVPASFAPSSGPDKIIGQEPTGTAVSSGSTVSRLVATANRSSFNDVDAFNDGCTIRPDGPQTVFAECSVRFELTDNDFVQMVIPLNSDEYQKSLFYLDYRCIDSPTFSVDHAPSRLDDYETVPKFEWDNVHVSKNNPVAYQIHFSHVKKIEKNSRISLDLSYCVPVRGKFTPKSIHYEMSMAP